MRIKNLKMSFLLVAFLGLSSCYVTNQKNEIDGYGFYRWGSNSWNLNNVDSEFLNESDSRCVTRSKKIISENNKVQSVSEIDCIEVQNLNKNNNSQIYYQYFHSFFNSGAGIVLIIKGMELL